jgi:hypothetical protein
MLEFIISKIGILLFAVATASVLIFFSLGMKDIFVGEQGREIATSIIKQAKGLSETDALCTSLRMQLPRYIDIYGSTETFSLSAITYVFKVSSVDLGNNKTSVVFSMYKKSGNKIKDIFAVDSFNTNSQVIFKDNSFQNDADNFLYWDPTSPTENVIYIVKNMSLGQEKIYFVKCGYDTKNANHYESCYLLLKELKENEGVYCVPTEQ